MTFLIAAFGIAMLLSGIAVLVLALRHRGRGDLGLAWLHAAVRGVIGVLAVGAALSENSTRRTLVFAAFAILIVDTVARSWLAKRLPP